MFNTKDGELFQDIRTDVEFDKAKKGTQQYEEWLRKYREKKSQASKDSEGKTEKKTPEKKSRQDLLDKPPVFVTDKETWTKAVNKITYGGKQPASYGAAVSLYKLKMKKKEVETKN